jgi:hypothetical protein
VLAAHADPASEVGDANVRTAQASERESEFLRVPVRLVEPALDDLREQFHRLLLRLRLRQPVPEPDLTPKTFARVRRFTRALRRREREPSLGGAGLAAACGYVDQAHMTRDFQEFAGSSPAALWRRGLPDGGGFVD